MEIGRMQATKKDKRERRDSRRSSVAELVKKLGSRNGMERQHAREALVGQGEPAVGPLIAALSADRDVVRWEAAKAFTDLHAARAALALVKTLEDEDGDVRWLAAEALIGLGNVALTPIFEALMARAGSIELREGAHHVLRALNRGDLSEIVEPVLRTLEHYEPELAVPFSAEEALARLKKGGS
jgi:HEAT repeat protein